MIEKASAVENLEALLSVKGVDMVQFGPADYSMSIGLAGQWSHPRVIEAERHVISHPSEAKAYLDLGVRHFCMGWDVSILFDWFKREGRALREALGGG